jgi:hypothetical protein
MGFKLIKDKKLRNHGVTMGIAVILHTIPIILVMIPSFLIYSNIMIKGISSPGVIITWVHVIAGVSAEILGIFLVAEWRFRLPPKMTCAKRRRLMIPALILWSFALILGIAFYVYYYVWIIP